MVEINGAKPEGFQTEGVVEITATVDATAYVGPNARVLGNAQVRNNARVEGRAVVKGNAQIRDNAVVKDYATVAGGQVYGNAVVSEGANVWNGQIFGDAKVHGAANIVHSGVRISGNAQVGGVVLLDAATVLSGTVQLLGDGEVYDINASSGVYYGLVDAGVIGDNQYGGNRAQPPTEVTKPRAMKWPDEPTNIFAVKPSVQFFKLNNSGIFSYNLGEASSANLKIFDGRGRLLKAMPLSGSQGVVNVQLGSVKVLFWKVVLPNGKNVSGRMVVWQ
jgi:carbonic anhydrase/acetyltransferase-like protein (isoleucine patch superfamily)